eukprot:6176834-Pleurochrysis_carterae.AAC.1
MNVYEILSLLCGSVELARKFVKNASSISSDARRQCGEGTPLITPTRAGRASLCKFTRACASSRELCKVARVCARLREVAEGAREITGDCAGLHTAAKICAQLRVDCQTDTESRSHRAHAVLALDPSSAFTHAVSQPQQPRSHSQPLEMRKRWSMRGAEERYRAEV